MRISTKNFLRQDVPLYTGFDQLNISLVVGMFLVGLSLVGHGGLGMASTVIEPLQIHQERVTGTVRQWSLRLLLDQFQEQLGIKYQASNEVLEERVSVDLEGESLPQALDKILAQWDYAITVDPTGKVQEIFIVEKDPTKGSDETALQTEDDHSNSSNNFGVDKRTQKSMEELQGTAMVESPVASSTLDTSHPVVPQELSPQERRQLQDALNEAGMGILPPPDSLGMEVQQISVEDQQAILQSLDPATRGSLDEPGFQEMPIAPVSEEEANEILRSLNQSIGSAKGNSPP